MFKMYYFPMKMYCNLNQRAANCIAFIQFIILNVIVHSIQMFIFSVVTHIYVQSEVIYFLVLSLLVPGSG